MFDLPPITMTREQLQHEPVSDRHRSAYEQLLNSQSATRRDFLKLLSASIAFAGLTGCRVRQPVEKIIPYVRQPEEIVPGKPQFYATAMTLGGYALGVLVESHEGRPTKIEGNPNHPASLGATDVFAQASILDLYDPDRSQTPLFQGESRSWTQFVSEFRAAVTKQRDNKGAGLRILTETISSPTLADQLQQLLKIFPQAKWHQYEPVNRDNALLGAQMVFGEFAETIYHFDKANVVVALDSDFLMCGPANVRYSRDFMSRRRVRKDNMEMNRLYVIETTPSNTGAIADHRLSVKLSQLETFTRAIAAALGLSGGTTVSGADQRWIDAIARDLQSNRGASIVLAGEQQSAAVHALAHHINESLGNTGKTITYSNSIVANPTIQLDSLRQLVTDMSNGQVELLLILEGNPVFNAPVDFYFADNLAKVPFRIHHSLYYDETSASCQWHINAAHYLESWSDARAFDGTVSIVQPLIAPLYSGKTAHETLAALTDRPEQTSYDIVREYWLRKKSAATSEAKSPASTTSVSADFHQWWTQALRDGVIEGTAESEKKFALKDFSETETFVSTTQPPNPKAIEIVFRPDPAIYDGRFANNGWLQELPKPLTKITWDNAAIVSPETARRLSISVEPDFRGGEHGANVASVIEISNSGHSVRAPIWILPGQTDDVITIHLGYGRTRTGQIGTANKENRLGFDAYQLRTSNAPWFALGEIRKTDETYRLACTQGHFRMEGRDLIRSVSMDEYRSHPDFAKRQADLTGGQISLYPGWSYPHYSWGMSIDTTTCIGCNACVVACQAENNIPIVGKEEVTRAREMHWLRIDRYFEGDERNPRILFQPVPCQHCENAPCELVCPVEATTHSDEGVNEMTYNRCVGTRYCSNNCPYKVRRFNFFDYASFDQPLLELQRNPNVTVRSRGVMEKCTYCIQRISAAKIQAETEDRRVNDGEITPACQQACPVEAIVFGDLNDPNSRVTKLKSEPTDYGLLAELNTRPRTSYLARIRNPNPSIET